MFLGESALNDASERLLACVCLGTGLVVGGKLQRVGVSAWHGREVFDNTFAVLAILYYSISSNRLWGAWENTISVIHRVAPITGPYFSGAGFSPDGQSNASPETAPCC